MKRFQKCIFYYNDMYESPKSQESLKAFANGSLCAGTRISLYPNI